jgi:GNAT superfamily N-acetyltransferase
MSIHIRRAVADDVELIAPLFDAYRIFYKQTSNIALAKTFLTERLHKDESIVFIAFDDDEAVGFVQMYTLFSSVYCKRKWLLNDLFVAEKARTKGVADALLNTSVKFATSTDSYGLLLQTAVDNFRAQKVYERNGWVRDEKFFVYNFAI